MSKKTKNKKCHFLTQTLFCPYKVTSHYELNQNIHSPVFTHQEKKKKKSRQLSPAQQ
jgi:hypothetical protein